MEDKQIVCGRFWLEEIFLFLADCGPELTVVSDVLGIALLGLYQYNANTIFIVPIEIFGMNCNNLFCRF